jgi:hypothetical protein
MGRTMPRIYAALDNKKYEFKYHMTEVESNINEQPIVILIDTRAIHSYIDPKLVEIFHFPRSNIGNLH